MIYQPFDPLDDETRRYRRSGTTEEFEFRYEHDPIHDGRSRETIKEEMTKQFHDQAEEWLDEVKGQNVEH